MASFFGHAATALTIGRLSGAGRAWQAAARRWRFWVAIVTCATAADLDVIGFWFGVPYQSDWGHRGFTHSLVFALALALVLATLCSSGTGDRAPSKPWLKRAAIFFAAGATHPLLDMLTNGGLGVAVLWPFNSTRYFFPYRPIEVSPIGVGEFFTARGLEVLSSELLYIFLPCAILLGIQWAACARKPASRS